MKPLNGPLVGNLVIVDLGFQSIAVDGHLLQPAAQILKMCSSLLQKLFELFHRRDGVLNTRNVGGSVLELPLQCEHLLAHISRFSVRVWLRPDLRLSGFDRLGRPGFDVSWHKLLIDCRGAWNMRKSENFAGLLVARNATSGSTYQTAA